MGTRRRRIHRVLATAVTAAAVAASLFAPLPALAAPTPASPTYRYDYTRSGAVVDPDLPADAVLSDRPWVVPVPGESLETPVTWGGTLYMVTHDGPATHATLWAIDISTDPPGPARAVVTFSALEGEDFGVHSTMGLGVSPDGRYVALAAGRRLFWAPRAQAGDPGAWQSEYMFGPNTARTRDRSSSDPVFVPVPASVDPSGYAVCGADWNGSLWCYGVSGRLPWPTKKYYVNFDHPDDTYAAITAAPTVLPEGVGAGGTEVCAGVSGTNHPRIACVHPDGSPYAGGKPYRIIGDGQFYKYAGWSSGVAAAAMLDAGDPAAGGYRAHPNLVVQDLWGGLYRFDPQTGGLMARSRALAEPGDLTIAAPAVHDGLVVAVGHGWDTVCVLSEYDFAPLAAGAGTCQGLLGFGGRAGLRPATIVQDAGGPDTLRVLVAGNDVIATYALPKDDFEGLLPAESAKGDGNYSWSAPVADVGPLHYTAYWGNRSTDFWCSAPFGGTWEAARVVGGCPAARKAGAHGGVQLWRFVLPLTAWIVPNPAVGGDRATLYVMADPRYQRLTVRLWDGTRKELAPDGYVGTGTFFPDMGPAALEGLDPFAPRETPCGTRSLWAIAADLFQGVGCDGLRHPWTDMAAGTATGVWEREGDFYYLYRVDLGRSPGLAGAWPVEVVGTTDGMGAYTVEPVLHTTCGPGEGSTWTGECFVIPPGWDETPPPLLCGDYQHPCVETQLYD